jgi:hypothetical protein
MFKKLTFSLPNNYSVNHKQLFSPLVNLNSFIDEVFGFAFEMTFAHHGHHRNHRSGGTNERKNGELFVNTFQGKLAEFAFYTLLKSYDINCPKPDLTLMEKGLWDDGDFTIKGKKISIKSAAHFSNLMLLEEKDWGAEGIYIPSQQKYDCFIFCRIHPDGKQILKDQHLYHENKVEKQLLKNLLQVNWEADFPGFVNHKDLVSIINDGFILPKNSLLNGKIKMDATNYYIQSGDFKPIERAIERLQLL